GAGAFVSGLLAPVRSGIVLTRADLARAARDLGLGLRMGERRFILETLLAQDAGPMLVWLAGAAGGGTPPQPQRGPRSRGGGRGRWRGSGRNGPQPRLRCCESWCPRRAGVKPRQALSWRRTSATAPSARARISSSVRSWIGWATKTRAGSAPSARACAAAAST